jgi:hypothetical protein
MRRALRRRRRRRKLRHGAGGQAEWIEWCTTHWQPNRVAFGPDGPGGLRVASHVLAPRAAAAAAHYTVRSKRRWQRANGRVRLERRRCGAVKPIVPLRPQ